LHCDSLTKSYDYINGINSNLLQASVQNLIDAGATAQCYAIFTSNANESDFLKYVYHLKEQFTKYGQLIKPILNFNHLKEVEKEGKLGVILTVENLAFIKKDVEYINELSLAGVKMASLVWNYKNELAYPNVKFNNGTPNFALREKRGLTKLGRQAVELLDKNKIIIDLSHLSDGGVNEILKGRKIPVVASHSNAAAIKNVSRNLTDGQIKAVSNCGGVIGVNFCKDFVGECNIFQGLLQHIKHLINVGGEDVVALGSDFDGIPEVKDLENCKKLPKLFSYLYNNGIKEELLEKFARKNFERVFKEVVG
ncbi:MAG: membrane dipeptidase, partial [Clostridia bacterium]|nr:membrane dipeptidase [Clostridia bacterium]